MPSNKQIIEKAALTLADLSAGGLMNPTQSNEFIRMMQNAPTILNSCRTIPMDHDTMKIEKIGFGQRILRPGVELTSLAEDKKAKPTFSKVDLAAKEVIAEINLSYDSLENNIEGQSLKDTIMQLIAGRAALDLEELIFNADTASADEYLALINGIRKQATSHVVDFASAAVSKDLFKLAKKAMPAKFMRNPADFRYYTSNNTQTEWLDVVASRATGLGDSALQGSKANAYGIPVEGIAMLQSYDDGTGKLVSDAILTHPKNIITGISRRMSIEVDKDIRARMFIIVLTTKIDCKFEEEDAVVKVKKILE
jgi:HK97 family phage major capsid protein